METGGETLLPSLRTDIRWKFCQPTHENSTIGGVCNFCAKTIWGGITILKEHLMGNRGNCKPSLKFLKEVREELYQHAKNKKKQENEVFQKVKLDMIDDYCDRDEEVALDKGSRERHSTGPLIYVFWKLEIAIQSKKKKKLRQTNIKVACEKELTTHVHQYITRFWYQAGLYFNMIKLESFQDTLTTVETFGRHLEAPSYHEIRITLLNKELEHTEELLEGQRDQ